MKTIKDDDDDDDGDDDGFYDDGDDSNDALGDLKTTVTTGEDNVG